MANKKRVKVDGRSVYLSEEFKGLCKLIGIDHDQGTKDITIRITEDEVWVSHNYKAVAVIDEEGQRGETFLTQLPAPVVLPGRPDIVVPPSGAEKGETS